MSRVCQITGKRVMGGHSVSHSNRKTNRRFYPNLSKRKFYLPEEERWITLKVSANGLKTISKNGLLDTLKKAQKKGLITSY